MRKLLIPLFLLGFLSVAYAEVSFISATSGAPVKEQEAQTFPYPQNLSIDDEMLNKDIYLYKYEVCLKGTEALFIRDKKNEEQESKKKKYKVYDYETVLRCKTYIATDKAQDKQAMLNSALKDLSVNIPEALFIRSQTPFEQNTNAFNLKDRAQIPFTPNYDAPIGTIFKKILTNKTKIKKLYNFNIDVSTYISQLVKNHKNNDMPIRLTFYQAIGEEASSPLKVVIVFSEEEKYLFNPAPQIFDKKIYDIEPDFVVQYLK